MINPKARRAGRRGISSWDASAVRGKLKAAVALEGTCCIIDSVAVPSAWSTLSKPDPSQ